MDEATTAPALLRYLRRRARLSQFQLAERCGLSDRTIRGLESGAIRTPQQATLRLLADALELTGQERNNFDASWQRQRGEVWLDTLLSKGRGADAELSRRLRAHYDSVREVTHWSRRCVDRHRRAVGLTVRRGFVVERGEVSSWLFAFGRNPGADVPDVVATENCRFERAHEYGPNAWLLEFAFDRAITAGEAYTFSIDLEPRPSGGAPPATDLMVAIAANLPSLTLEVQFDAAALPVELCRVTTPLLDGEQVVVGAVELSPFHTAHLVLQHPDAAFHGLRWSWPDD